jgi:hypothetical protein
LVKNLACVKGPLEYLQVLRMKGTPFIDIDYVESIKTNLVLKEGELGELDLLFLFHTI